jgi:outer membrane protein assembly factor BamE (lipoprotein component of BamABCDE complex)
MRSLFILASFVVVVLAAGCTHHAYDVSQQLQNGMSQSQVVKLIGMPLKKKLIRFKGHTEDYLVYEYEMVPDVPV